MQVSHTPAAVSAVFDDPNLVSAAGADSIDDMALLRHGAMGKLLTRIYAPSTLGSFLRAFTFGHVRQLDAVASRLLQALSHQSPLLVPAAEQYTFLDVDDTIIEVHGHQKQGSGYGYSGVRGLNALLVTARMDPAVKKAIAAIAEDSWTPIAYPEAIYDETTDRWISTAEVAEVPFTAFTSKPKNQQVPGRLVVRRIPELNKDNKNVDQPGLFDLHRLHAFFTTSTLDTVTADKTHRRHAVIEQVNADLKNSALAHLPSRVFTANAAWLVLAAMAFNLTRAAATITGPVWPRPPRPRSGARSSASPPGSPPRPVASSCVYRKAGHGRTSGEPCSTTGMGHRRPSPPDHRRQHRR